MITGETATSRVAAQAAPARQPGQQTWLRKHGVTLVLVLALLVGLGLILYPTFSDWWNQYHQSRAIMGYTQATSDLSEEQCAEMLAAAQEYNDRLAQTGEKWRMTEEEEAEYNSLLDVDGTGVMGYITIPKINVQLPVYHGTEEAVLQTSIGHLAGTSLPVGGESAHASLSGHRGLPSARLFSDLDQLTEGDTFTITVLNQTLTYEVDQIRIVEPDDLSNLQIEQGQDYCTLITCTPYGINTHRLLVRGHRIPNANGDAQVIAEAVQIRPLYIAVFISAIALAVLVAYTLLSTWRRGKAPDVVGSYLGSCGIERPAGADGAPWRAEAPSRVHRAGGVAGMPSASDGSAPGGAGGGNGQSPGRGDGAAPASDTMNRSKRR